MQITTTFRGLNRAESASATSALERTTSRLDRLIDQPVPLRAVIEGGPPEYKVTLSMSLEGEDFVAQDSGHDLGEAISTSCERMRNQLLKMRRRRQANRQRTSTEA
jgi:ribosome-associated translation inhibitor RaiA